MTIGELRKKLEIVQKEKDGIQFNVDKLENASKSLNKIIKSQIVANCKKGLGYNAVPPPLTGDSMPLKPDLSFTGLEEFTSEPVVIKSVVENSEAKASEEKSKIVRKNNGAPIIEDWVSNSEDEDVPQDKIEKKIAKPSFVKIDFSHPYAKRNKVPKAVLIKSGLVSVNTARQVNDTQSKTTVNAARPMSHLSKTAHSTDKNVNIARPRAVVNAVQGNNVNAVKASACWVWKPNTKVLDHVSKHNSASTILKRFDYIDAQGRSKIKERLIVDAQAYPSVGQSTMDFTDKGVIDSGCSRHMTGNMSYLTDYEEIDGGYVAFGGNPKGGKITGKVITDDYSRFTWVFFLATKDETSDILKSFITGIENLIDL
ncbi:hypothetical protein Tco_1530595 [Tanacetum coccineum]